MKKIRFTCLLSLTAVAFAAAPLAAAAWSHGKPGLWATTVEMHFDKGGPPPIAPEQLEKMKQMGIKLPFGEPVTTNICITPEQAAQDQPPRPPQRDNSCQPQNLQKNGSSYSGDLVCNGTFKGGGHFQSNYASDESYAGTMNFAGTSPHGEIAMTNQFSGKWLAADCGSVAPFKTPQ